MSKSPGKHSNSGTREIPIRRVLINDPSQLPFDYSTTPGGTLFYTTPGGSKIIYDRAFLMQCRNSPLAKSPPPNLPKIPGVTSPSTDTKANGHTRGELQKVPESTSEEPHEP